MKAASIACILFAVIVIAVFIVIPPPDARPVSTPEEDALLAGAVHDTAFVVEGIRQPPATPAADTGIADEAAVIGVNIDGLSRAYLVRAMSGMTTHVVNDVLGTVPVSVTYCDQNDCVRVFTLPNRDRPTDLSQMGYVNHQLMLRHGDISFEQQSTSVPLDELTFERTTWGEWKAAHPETDIVLLGVDDEAVSNQHPSAIENVPVEGGGSVEGE